MYMPYCTEIKGVITFCEGISPSLQDILEDKIKDKLGALQSRTAVGNTTVLSFSGRREYDESIFSELYGELSNYIRSAEIEFAGEDGELWKDEFNDGTWTQRKGRITYSERAIELDITPYNNRHKEER